MKAITIIFSLLTFSAIAGDVPIENIWYQMFEHAYTDNDAENVGRWLAKKAKHIETIHFPDRKPSTKVLNKRQVLAFLKKQGAPYNVPPTNYFDLKIDKLGERKFCATREVMIKAPFEGITYDARLVRKVCFVPAKVTEHKIDIYYTK